jgi:eukaryotic sulfide quinone oxidoreductase
MFKVIIAGGGSASAGIVGHLLRSGKFKAKDIAVIEPSPNHYYQPGFTMIGGGLMGTNEKFLKKSTHLIKSQTRSMFDLEVAIIPKHVKGFDPENNTLTLSEDESIRYENLIVALGVGLDFEAIPGLIPALNSESSPVCSIYSWDYALKTNRLAGAFKGGNAIFCQPNNPIKCGGAPQKILYLSHDRFTKSNIKSNLEFYTSLPTLFTVPKYSEKLKVIAESKGIKLHMEHLITKIDDANRIAYFKNKEQEIAVPYDFIHVVPPHKPHNVLKNSKLVDSVGYVEVDKETTRHIKYKNVWSCGDCSNLPTSKTMAASISQSYVLVNNLIKSLENKELNAKYNGYTSCPIFVGQNKLMLCEFKYGLEVDETFTKKQDQPYTGFYLIKKYFFPRIYFQLIKRGWWFGKNLIFKPKFN